MRLLLILLFLSSACGQPSAETRAVTDGRLTLKIQQVHGISDSYRLVVCRQDTCRNALLTYDDQQVLFRDGDQQGDDQISLRRLDSAKTVTEKSGGSMFADVLSATVAIGIGAGVTFLILRFARGDGGAWRRFTKGVAGRLNYDDWLKIVAKHGDRPVEIIPKPVKRRYHVEMINEHRFTDDNVKKWKLTGNKRGQATFVDSQGTTKEMIYRKWPGLGEWYSIYFTASGGALGGYLYLKDGDRSAMLADRLTADNWPAIFSKDPMVNVRIKKDVRYIVYSLAQTFDLKVNKAALQ